MKRNFILAISAISALTLVSCEMLDDGMYRPEKKILRNFDESYPKARDVDWDFENGYWVVSFDIGWGVDKEEYEAWYDVDGNWMMTKRELYLANVPRHIKDALAADPEYGNARIGDGEVEHYVLPNEEFYRFDIIHNGREVEVDVSEEGEVSLAKRL